MANFGGDFRASNGTTESSVPEHGTSSGRNKKATAEKLSSKSNGSTEDGSFIFKGFPKTYFFHVDLPQLLNRSRDTQRCAS